MKRGDILIANGSFYRIKVTILKFTWNHKRSQIAKIMLRKNKKAGGIMLPNYKLYCKPIVIKTVWYWNKNRHIHQWNRNKSPEIRAHAYMIN